MPRNTLCGILICGLIITSCSLGQDTSSDLITILYKIPAQQITSTSSNPFPKKSEPLTEKTLSSAGINFPPKSKIIKGLDFAGFGMYNTADNHKKLQAWLTKKFGDKWSVVKNEPK